MVTNKHGVDISEIKQGDNLEVRAYPDDSRTYLVSVDSDPTYDIKYDNYISVKIIDSKDISIINEDSSEKITNFERISGIVN